MRQRGRGRGEEVKDAAMAGDPQQGYSWEDSWGLKREERLRRKRKRAREWATPKGFDRRRAQEEAEVKSHNRSESNGSTIQQRLQGVVGQVSKRKKVAERGRNAMSHGKPMTE